MIDKRAQAGTAAGVIALIAVLIVFYVLFLPADIRNDLLNGTETSTSSSSSSSTLSKNVLVFEHPGTLDPVKLRDREKVLDSFNLFTEKSAVVLKSVDALHVESGWLRRKSYNLSFKVDDVENTDNYVLALDVANSYGRLVITLNGKQIYDSEIAVGNAQPIKLDKENIRQQNSLIFSASDVGLAFWRLNEYEIKNARVIADFIDVSKKEYKNFFIISATEKENFDTTKLNFVPYCLTKYVSPLTIRINDRELHYAAIPDCGLLSTVEFDPALLKQGENSITFRAEQGNYFIDRVSIKADLKELKYPFYYFELKEKDFERIDNETANVTLKLQFADKEDKLGELNVNGHLSSIDTDNATYEKNINKYVEEDQNYITITPKTIMNIVDLKVVFEK